MSLCRRLLLALFAAAALGYAFDLGGASIWDANEAFYVETPREMIESGDYINPSFNYEPRFNKPVLSYWIVAALYRVFGVSVAAERAAIALAAIAMIAAALLLARAASAHPLAPLLGAIGLAANPRFFMFARRILIDVALAACMTLVLLCFVLAERTPAHRRRYLAGMYIAVGLGVLTKGPVAAALPALVFLAYLAVHRELPRVREMMILPGAAIVLAIAAPWYVALYLHGGWTHIHEFFVSENLERYTSLVGPQSRGFWFYLPVLVSDSLPWSLCLPAAVAAWIRERRHTPADATRRVRTLLLLWIAVIVAFFSVSQTKQDLYILPIVAAVAALGGDIVARGVFGSEPDVRRWLRGTLVAASIVCAIVGGALFIVFAGRAAPYALAGTTAIGVLALAGGAAAGTLALARRPGAALVVVLGVFVGFNWTLVTRVLPSFERYKPVVPLSETLLRHLRPGDAIVHYDVALPSMVFYVRQHIEMTFDREAFLRALRAPAAALAVLPADGYDAMRAALTGTCVLDRRATADVKLREVLSGAPPPAVLLISTRCPP